MSATHSLRQLAAGLETVLVAIDGPAGSGKSSVAKAAATELGFGILDTGAAYRALTYMMLRRGANLDSAEQAVTALTQLELELPLAPELPILVLGEDVTEEIRGADISPNVSRVSQHQAVRELLNAGFRERVRLSGLAGVIIEGRDITTVVAPDAPVRLILTASQRVRAERRHKQMPELSFDEVLADLKARDEKDLRVVNFVDPAPGVELIDTTDLSFDESVAAVVRAVRERVPSSVD